MSTHPLTAEDLVSWSRYVHEACGVFLDGTKGYLIETRLAGLLRDSGSAGWAELLAKVRADMTGALKTNVVDAVTTNETSFFRDTSPFELLRHKIFPELIDRRVSAGIKPVPIRILSAACSTGQEAYTTLIVLKELLGDFRGYDIRLLGLDISDTAVAQASYGHYSRQELDRGLGQDKLDRHFEPAGNRYKIRDELRASATFRKANLLEPLNAIVPFDVVFCRNVAIYFTEQDKIRLFKNIGRVLAKDGALIIGATETITAICSEFEPQRYLRAVFYRHKA